MKFYLLLPAFLILANSSAFCQQNKKDFRPQLVKEDGNNVFNTGNISELDLIQALDFAGIRIHKFDLGSFDKNYQITIVADEFKDGKLIKSRVLLQEDVEYHYYTEGEKKYFLDFIDQIKVFTRLEKEELKIRFKTYELTADKELPYSTTSDDQFWNLRVYADASWKLDQNVPLLVFASSWEDKKYGFQRFCGVVHLEEGNKDTDELLNNSPHYFMVSYKVSN